MTEIKEPKVKFIHLLLPLVFLSLLIGYGLIWRPHFANQQALPLEVVFLLASCYSITQLLLMGYTWEKIQDAVITKIAKGFPAILILFAIGIIIGSWIVSGTMPMLVYWGIKLIEPDYIYLLAFIIPIVFTSQTSTKYLIHKFRFKEIIIQCDQGNSWCDKEFITPGNIIT